jgi:hypothetical protein
VVPVARGPGSLLRARLMIVLVSCFLPHAASLRLAQAMLRLRTQDSTSSDTDCREILAPLDRQGILGDAPELQTELDNDALMAELEGLDGRITDPDVGPLFGSSSEEGDLGSGTIYVLRSNCKDPRIADHREVIHKIGVTGNDVEARIASARVDPTFLLADAEIVATYELFNVNRVKLENLIHKFFEPARLDLEMEDRFGNPFRPREWFLVPLDAVDDAVRRIKDGTIVNCRYDVDSARVVVV